LKGGASGKRVVSRPNKGRRRVRRKRRFLVLGREVLIIGMTKGRATQEKRKMIGR